MVTAPRTDAEVKEFTEHSQGYHRGQVQLGTPGHVSAWFGACGHPRCAAACRILEAGMQYRNEYGLNQYNPLT